MMKMIMSVENWLNDDRQGKAEVLGENSASEPLRVTRNRPRQVRRTAKLRMIRRKGAWMALILRSSC
jgi:hypothetical protein